MTSGNKTYSERLKMSTNLWAFWVWEKQGASNQGTVEPGQEKTPKSINMYYIKQNVKK